MVKQKDRLISQQAHDKIDQWWSNFDFFPAISMT